MALKMSGNKLSGRISNIAKGAANANVTVDIGNGQSVHSTLMTTSLKDLGLEVGEEVYAVFKGASVSIVVKE